jgi:circadian clock protein KaiC
VLTGSARLAQLDKERAAALVREQDIQLKQRELNRKRQVVEAQIAALRSGLEVEEEELELALVQARDREKQLVQDREEMSRRRKADTDRVKGEQNERDDPSVDRGKSDAGGGREVAAPAVRDGPHAEVRQRPGEPQAVL